MLENLNSTIESSLWNAYSEVRFDFKKSWKPRTYGIITAWNPYSKPTNDDQNRINNQKLIKKINAYNWCKVYAGSPDFSWVEESFAVVHKRRFLIELGRQFHQNAIYFVENNELFLISCVEHNVTTHLGNISEYIVLGGNNERHHSRSL